MTEKRRPGRPTNASKGLPTVRPSVSTVVAVAPEAKKIKNRYDAAGSGRRVAGWNPPSTGPNSTKGANDKLISRTRDSVRNDWASKSIAQKWATTLIGVGITPRFKRIKSIERRQEITDLFSDWMKVCDADGTSHGYGLQTLAVLEQVEAGEVFCRIRWRDPSLPLPVPVQLQLIESEQCPNFDQTLQGGDYIKQGVEFNKYGRRLAYWFHKEHPGDGGTLVSDPSGLIRVVADQVLHIYKPGRAGEVRGVSMLATILMGLRDSADYSDAVLVRQKLANLFVGVLTKTLEQADIDRDPLSNEVLQSGKANEPLMPLAPGIVQELAPGESMTFSNPPEAGTTYSDYIRTNYLGISSGVGMPYELFSGDIKDISDRTLRILVNEFRRYAEQEQWQITIPKLCDPVISAFADAAVLVGKLTLAEAELVKRCEHAPHGWPHIHPIQDPQGKQLEVDNGFRSRSSVIAERGDDPDQIDAERKADKDRENKLGLEQKVVDNAPSNQKKI